MKTKVMQNLGGQISCIMGNVDPGEMKTKVMQNLGGQISCIMGNVEVAYACKKYLKKYYG